MSGTQCLSNAIVNDARFCSRKGTLSDSSARAKFYNVAQHLDNGSCAALSYVKAREQKKHVPRRGITLRVVTTKSNKTKDMK